MVNIGKICNNCNCELKKYDKVYRTIRVKGGAKMKVNRSYERSSEVK